MEKKQLHIKPLAYKGGPQKGLTFHFILEYDQHTRRLVTVKTPYANYKQDPTKPSILPGILKTIMDRSDIPMTMTESEFMNLEWKQFTNVKIYDKLL